MILTDLLEQGKILSFRKATYSIAGYGYEQFQPDFEIILPGNRIMIIDVTTSIRTDRIKQKQWDANGVKMSLNASDNSIEFFIVVPDKNELGNEKTNRKEIAMVENERNKMTNPTYYSKVDGVLYFSEWLLKIASPDEALL